jgi:26S proteasome regulatory subunit T5
MLKVSVLLNQIYLQGMIALRRGATSVTHEDFMDAIMEVQAKKKANLNYYA